MRLFLTILLTGLITVTAAAQTFEGRVSDEENQAVPFATLYIRELSQGFVTDDNGYYRTQIPVGNYTIDVSSLGYNQQTLTLTIPPKGLQKNIVLSERVYQLREVQITRNNEDPAYTVIRKAIAHAPFYRHYLKSYTAETYLKGSARVKKVPGILKINKDVRKEVKKIEDKLFVMEEQRIVTFTAPNNWDNRVLAYTNSFPENIYINIETTNINLYNPKLFGKISPLAPGSFSYYKFKLEGCYTENDRLVNKIRIIPRKDSPDLISGHIYIIEELWSVSAANIRFTEMGIKADVQVNCKEINPAVFLPVSVSLSCVFDILGVKADASYLTSMKYSSVETTGVNLASAPSITQAVAAPVVTSRGVTSKQQKVQEKIDKLAGKEELSTRDAYKLSRLIAERENLEADTVRSGNKFERPGREYRLKIERDSLAACKDSAYWANVRSVPLREEEFESYARKAELIAKTDTTSSGNENERSGRPGNPGFFDLFLNGNTYRTKNRKAWIELKGLSSYIPEYNFADGLWVGANVEFGVRPSGTTRLTFIPEAYYTTARKKWVGKGTADLKYAPRRSGNLVVSGGRVSEDFNKESGEKRWINALASLLFARNEIKFYDRTFAAITNNIEVANGLFLYTGVNWERRALLVNNVANSIFRRKAKPNLPENTDYTPMPDNEALTVTASLEFTPAHYYRMVQGRKQYEDPKFPTFTLRYDRAFGLNGSRPSPTYNRIELSARQEIEFGMFNTFYWSVNGGSFWNAEAIQFPDYKHFASTRFQLTERIMNEGFSLLNNYEYATATRWGQANITWQSPYILVKNLPFLRRMRFDEALHVRTLVVYDRAPYWEGGYSLGFGKSFRAGVFVGFDRMKYRSMGFSVTLGMGEWD